MATTILVPSQGRTVPEGADAKLLFDSGLKAERSPAGGVHFYFGDHLLCYVLGVLWVEETSNCLAIWYRNGPSGNIMLKLFCLESLDLIFHAPCQHCLLVDEWVVYAESAAIPLKENVLVTHLGRGFSTNVNRFAGHPIAAQLSEDRSEIVIQRRPSSDPDSGKLKPVVFAI